MELYLQFGYGMMEHSRVLVSRWQGGTVILSPRDLDQEQLPRLADSITGLAGGRVLLDPQFYLPHADHHRLCSHGYWPSGYDTAAFWQSDALHTLLDELSSLNQRLGCDRLILPGLVAASVDDAWLETQRAILEGAHSLADSPPLLATVALSDDVVRDDGQVSRVIEQAEQLDARGYYLVLEHPRGSYLVEDAIWVANVLDLAAGLKLLGREVIIGYCNQQMLIAGAANADAIASGSWMNVRSFPPEKFRSAAEEDIKRKAVWYYCPQALSEYRVTFLDLAYRQGALDVVQAPPEFDGGYVSGLFSAMLLPSTVGLTEGDAFRHYLHALHQQASRAVAGTFDETAAAYEHVLDCAQSLLETLHAIGVRGQHRDFAKAIDVNRGALALLRTTRGPMLRRSWATL